MSGLTALILIGSIMWCFASGATGFYLGVRYMKKTKGNKPVSLPFPTTFLVGCCVGLLLGGIALVIYSIKIHTSSSGPSFARIGVIIMIACGFFTFLVSRLRPEQDQFANSPKKEG